MKPDQKKRVHLIFWNTTRVYVCLCQLQEDRKIPYSNMMNVCMWVVLAHEHPKMLDWQLAEKNKFPEAPIVDVEVARKAVSPLSSNIDFFNWFHEVLISRRS